jgi:hypothetical protein
MTCPDAMRITLMLCPLNPAGAAWFRSTEGGSGAVNQRALHVFATELSVPTRVMPAYRPVRQRDRDA